jgi:hypothetical protein
LGYKRSSRGKRQREHPQDGKRADLATESEMHGDSQQRGFWAGRQIVPKR